ncbi:hypothetical protein M9Y10_009419 [Tritrichomonas musculus]|uniref:TPR Domain containing protein n=1 Tax=Tritrichomonas musculus TaxID=1915356 RepID=A0ABR2IQT1_9EUKA
MNNSSSIAAGLLSKTLDRATKEYERSWGKLADLTSLFQSSNDTSISLCRLISYNPTTLLEKNSNLSMEYFESDKIEKIDQSKEAISQQIIKTANQIEKDPSNVKLWIILGHCYALLNDFTNAYTAYTNVLNLDPSNKDPYFLYGIGSVRLHFKILNEKGSHFQNISLDKMPEAPDVHLRFAIMLRMMGENFRALKEFDDILQRKSLPPNLTVDDINFQKAFTYQLSNQHAKAKSMYESLYQNHPNTIEIIQQYCWFLSLSKDPQSLDEAERIIKKADINDPLLNFVKAQIAMKKDDMNTAYQSYCNCISFWSDSPLFWCGLGVLYFKNDQSQDAIVAFQRALYLKGELVEAWANLGLIFEFLGEPQNAMKIYEAAESKCENNQIIIERKKELQMGRRQPSQSMILEVNDSKYFQQVAEKIANQYIADSPFIPPEQIGLDSSYNIYISNHRSLF